MDHTSLQTARYNKIVLQNMRRALSLLLTAQRSHRQHTMPPPHISCPRRSAYLGRLHRSTLPGSTMGAALTRHQRSRFGVAYHRPCPHANGARWTRSPRHHARICRNRALHSTGGPHLPCTGSTQRVRASASHASTSPLSPPSTTFWLLGRRRRHFPTTYSRRRSNGRY